MINHTITVEHEGNRYTLESMQNNPRINCGLCPFRGRYTCQYQCKTLMHVADPEYVLNDMVITKMETVHEDEDELHEFSRPTKVATLESLANHVNSLEARVRVLEQIKETQ